MSVRTKGIKTNSKLQTPNSKFDLTIKTKFRKYSKTPLPIASAVPSQGVLTPIKQE